MSYPSPRQSTGCFLLVRHSICTLLLCLLVTAGNQTVFGQSPFGNALSFNGAGQGVIVPNFGNIIPTNEITVEFWAYSIKPMTDQSAFTLYPAQMTNSFDGRINTPDSLGMYGGAQWDFGKGNGPPGQIILISTPFDTTSNWVHYAFVASQSGNSMSIYIDGVLQTSQTGMTPFLRGNYNLEIGGGHTIYNGFVVNYTGLLDDFRVWSVALSAAQIQANYSAPLVGNEPNLLVYYKFDSSSGTVATNSAIATGPAYDGILTNGPVWVPSIPGLPPPLAATLPATGIGTNTATFNGAVNPRGLPTTTWFEWGIYPSLNTNLTPPVTLSGTNWVAVSNTVSGFTPGLIYHSCTVASNALGVLRGGSVPFGSSFIVGNFSTRTNECHTAFTASGAVAIDLPIFIGGGDEYSEALRADGRPVAWGDNSLNETNVPAALTNVVAIGTGDAHTLAVQSDGFVVAWGAPGARIQVPPGLYNVVAAAAGNLHNLVLKSDGTVFAWGDNTYGQTNVPSGLSNVVAIAAGDNNCLALRCDGSLAAWGRIGQTNLPAGLTNVVAISAEGNDCLALLNNQTVVAFGSAPAVPNGLTNVVAIAAGSAASACLALHADGTVTGWGYDGSDPIIATLTNVVAIASARNHSLATRSDGTVVAWGDNTWGQTNVPAGLNSIPLLGSGNLDTNTPGAYPLTFTFTNVLGGPANPAPFTVVVADTSPPVITILGSNPLTNKVNVPFVDPGATALDACEGSVPVSNTNIAVNVSVPGTYAVTYTAADNYTNTTNAVRTVVVVGPPSFGGFSAVVVGTNTANGSMAVQFTAAVDPEGADSRVNFQYGVTSTYAGTNGPVSVPAGFTFTNASVTVTGFSAAQLYHWNIAGTNIGGSASSPDQTFTIGSPPGSGVPGDIDGDGTVGQSEFDTVYVYYLTNNPWLYLTHVTGLGGTNVTFALSNSLLGGYTVQYSTNLTDWQALGPALPRYLFTDTNAPAKPHRYYRLAYP